MRITDKPFFLLPASYLSTFLSPLLRFTNLTFLFLYKVHPPHLMYFRTSTLLSRSCRYFLRTPVHQSYSPFSVSARSLAAVNAAMADATSGVTADLIKAKLTDQLQAQHVEIEDLSGK